MKKYRRRKVFKRHWILLVLARILAVPFIYIYFLFRPRYYRLRKKGPFLILGNHTTEFDGLLMSTIFNFPIYIVASEELLNKGWPSRILDYVFSPIPKSKSITDMAVVMRIKQVFDEGGSVCMFPEGNTSISGSMSPMPNALGKLVKFIKVPLVFVNSYGLYLSSPRWGYHRKFGPTGMKVAKIIEPEQYLDLDVEQINELIKQNLSVNTYEQRPQRKYRGFKKAEGLHRLVFVCPSCKKPYHMHSKGNYLRCNHCQYQATYDHYGYLNGPTGRFNMVELDHFVKQTYRDYVKENLENINLTFPFIGHYFEARSTKRSHRFKGILHLTNQGLAIINSKDDDVHYPFEDIISFATQPRIKFILYVKGNRSYAFDLEKKYSTYLLLITLQLLFAHFNYQQGKSDIDLFNEKDVTTLIGLL